MVSVVVIVPYRQERLQNREHHLAKFLEAMPTVLDAAVGPSLWAILVIEQSQDGQKFSRARCLNAGARIADVQYPGAQLVLHDVDLIPTVERARGYLSPPPPRGVLALNSDSAKYHESEQYVGGICAIASETFKLVNGFQNGFQGWGGEDDCFRDAIKSLHPPRCPIATWLTKFTEGKVKDLEDEDPPTCKRACAVAEFKCPKEDRRRLRKEAFDDNFNNGYAELVFEVLQDKRFPDTAPNTRMLILNLYITLEPGWCMAMSKSRHLPYYYRVLNGESTYKLPGAASKPPKRPRTESSLQAFIEPV